MEGTAMNAVYTSTVTIEPPLCDSLMWPEERKIRKISSVTLETIQIALIRKEP